MRFQVGLNVAFTERTADAGQPAYGSFEEFLDALMEHLLDLGFDQPSIGGSLETMQVEISVDVDSDSTEKAFVYGVSSIRAAIHAAHGSTPGWDLAFTERCADVRPLGDAALQEV